MVSRNHRSVIGFVRRLRTALTLLVLSVVLTACNTTGIPLPEIAEEINRTLPGGPTTVETGDMIDIRFPYQPELDQQVRVRTDGRATFHVGGELEVAGLTFNELNSLLLAFYREMLRETEAPQASPIVTVNLSEPAIDLETGPFVYVIGEVLNPGPVPLHDRELNLVQAISKAGGPNKRTALLQDVVLVRRLGDNQRQMWHIDARIDYWGSPVSIRMQPGDVVFVPNTAVDDVNIWIDQYIRQMIPFPYLIPLY